MNTNEGLAEDMNRIVNYLLESQTYQVNIGVAEEVAKYLYMIDKLQCREDVRIRPQRLSN